MTPSLLFVLLFSAFGIVNEEPDYLGTVCLRWQQPSAQWDSSAVPVGVTARELHKAIATLTRELDKNRVRVNYGYYAVPNPSTDSKAVGELWIDGTPIETLLAVDVTSPGVPHVFNAEQIVQAGKIAFDHGKTKERLAALHKTHHA